jgi:hypothetical protein
MRKAPALLVMSCTLVVCGPGTARAQPTGAELVDPEANVPRLRFSWEAPEGCPSRVAVLARAERLLGHPLESSLKAPLVIDATAAAVGAETWELRLASGDPRAPARLVTAASCAELGEVAALFTALAIEPSLHVESTARFADPTALPEEHTGADVAAPAAAEPPAAAAAPPAAPPTRRQEPTSSSPRPVAPRAPLPVRPLAAAFVALALGRLPGVAAGIGIEGGVAIDRLSLRGQLADFPERHAAATATTGGNLFVSTAGARAMYAFGEGTATLALSGGATLGWMHGTGTGALNRSSGDALLVALEPGVRAGYALSRSFSLVGDATLTMAVNRPRFVIDGLQEVYRPPEAGARFGLGAEWCPR